MIRGQHAISFASVGLSTIVRGQPTNHPMKSSTIHLRPLHVAWSLLLISAGLAVADTKLNGVVGRRTIDDDVTIASNTSCVLVGTTIKGNVRVLSGAKLVSKGARIIGNVQAFDAFKVDLKKSTRVNGDVQGEGTRSLKVRDGTLVGGNVQLKEGDARRQVALLVFRAVVEGDVQAEKSSGRLKAINNTIDGNLQFVENNGGPYLIKNNRIKGDLQYFKNNGSGTITGNRVGGNLQSKENSPSPQVANNIVDGDLELE